MKEKLVSVVVPIYNVEKYLDCCLESIVSQTFKNLDIILVDDGSPDSCPAKCDEWASKDPRIRVIHKENQGLGVARNTGIEHAKGEYICFFDSDDYVDTMTIEKAYNCAEKYNTDIVLYGLKDFNDTGIILNMSEPVTEKSLFEDSPIQNELLPDLIDCSQKGCRNKYLPFSAWSCLFSMELIKKTNWCFASEREIISEDSYSLIGLYKNVRKVYVLNEALYYHRRNYQSLSRSFRTDRFERTRLFAKETVKLASACGYSEKVINRICGLFFSFTIDAMKQIVLSNEMMKSKIKNIKEIVCDQYLHDCLKKCRYGKKHIAKWLLQSAIIHKLTGLVYVLVYVKAARDRII